MWFVELLFFTLLFWGITNTVHESAHMLSGYISANLKPKGFYPFWHWYDTRTNTWRIWRPWELWNRPEGFNRFYFARYRAKGRWPMGSHAPIHIAPLVADGAFSTVGLLHFVLEPSIPAAVMFSVFLIDAIVWIRGYLWGGIDTDGYKYRYGYKLP